MAHFGRLLLLFSTVLLINAKNNRVFVTLESYWPQTPIISEISEYIAEESIESFWRFAEMLEPLVQSEQWQAKPKKSYVDDLGLNSTGYIQLEQISLSALGVSASTSMHRELLRLFTSSRSYSPSVEMNHQAAITAASQLFNCSHAEAPGKLSQCAKGSCWAHIGTHAVCNVKEVAAFVKKIMDGSKQLDSLPRDKYYQPPNGTFSTHRPSVILYGDLSQPDWYEWHKEIKALANDGLCTYIFRHYFKERPSQKNQLNGYGVELALKSTEYKAMDDTKLEGNSTESTAQQNDSSLRPVVQGFNFSRLYQLYPDLENELSRFHKHLVDTDDEIRPLKIWEFRDLGFQASQAIVDAFHNANADKNSTEGAGVINPGLEALRDISQNLPSRASRLVTLKVKPSLREEVSNNQYVLSNVGVQQGQSVLLLNGMLLSPNVDVFALLELLRQESKKINKLHNIGVPENKIPDLLARAGSPGLSSSNANEASNTLPGSRYSLSGRFALDITTSPITYVNNLERDLAYRQWPDSLSALFTPDFSGGIRRLRRNLYNVVLMVDPAAPESHHMIRLAESFLLHKTAIRIGFLWSFQSNSITLSLVLARIFAYASSAVTSFDDSPFPVSIPELGSPGPMAGLSFLTDLYAHAKNARKEIDLKFVRVKFEKAFPNAYSEDIFDVQAGESEYDSQWQNHESFIQRSGLGTVGRTPLLIFNGVILDENGMHRMGGFEDTVANLCMEELVNVQNAVYLGQMSDTDSIFNLYQRRGVLVPRFNARLLSLKQNSYVSGQAHIVNNYIDVGSDVPSWPLDKTRATYSELLTFFTDHMRYFQKGDLEAATRPITFWIVVGDLDEIFTHPSNSLDHDQLRRDLTLAWSSLTYLRSAQCSKDTRMGIIFNPAQSPKPSSSSSWLTRILHLLGHPVKIPAPANSMRHNDDAKRIKYAEQMPARNYGIRLLKEALEALNSTSPLKSLDDFVASGIKTQTFKDALKETDRTEFMRLHSEFSQRVLGLKPGERAVVVNGRVFGPLAPTEDFNTDDFRLAEKLALDSGVKEINGAIDLLFDDVDISPEAVSEIMWQAFSILSSSVEPPSSSVTDVDAVEGILSKNRVRLGELSTLHSGFEVPSHSKHSMFELLAIVNPASRAAQRLSQILVVLHQALSCTIKILFNPVPNLPELPVKNYYRFVWEPSLFPLAPNDSSLIAPDTEYVLPTASFEHLPGESLLTLGMDAPHGWMVAATGAIHDLDNLRLADISSVVEAVFGLEYILLEGHCFEEGSMKPPRGLQLTLGPTPDLEKYDTIVMANLGYFQLKAGPGSWYLSIRAGRSRDLYAIVGHGQSDASLNTTEIVTTINSFRSNIVTVRVSKRPDRAGENLLDEKGITQSQSPTLSWLYKNSELWSTISQYADSLCLSWVADLAKLLMSRLHSQTCADREETINVFSLASGHLYERLLRIMMVTVIRHTKSPVKFWFLKNYLSPTFKNFIPHMAAEYGFQYELVEYQWPRWLHAQTEKQRIIWGYKILFLDVLFPLNVTKIIYVDADQIVRADLQELVDLDLQGAPYGYTPFCDSRKEMDGFRFWKHGYWANHLAGRPYHISALYVVDLTRFRQLAAGDRLRGQYHGLSQDPNSLSNLDQDLPNNMIHQVPIKSLPQEWLWCETWCSDESLERAKTIDLCNNPLTKEPKLSAAMRIAPEWVKIDHELKELWQRINPPSGLRPDSPVTRVVATQKAPEIPKPSDDVDDTCSADSGTCGTTQETTSSAFEPFGKSFQIPTYGPPTHKEQPPIERTEL